MAFALSFTACKKNDETSIPEASKVEATSAINTSAEQTYNDIVSITQSEGVDALRSMNGIMDNSGANPFARMSEATKKEQILDKIRRFKNIFTPSNKTIGFGRVAASDRFEFDAHLGTYTWNSESKSWDTTATSNPTSIVLNFPSDTNSTTNDAVLTISKYTDIAVTKDNGEEEIPAEPLRLGTVTTEYMPTSIEAELKIASVKQASLSLTASYNTSNGNPTSLSVTLFVNPFTEKTTFSTSGSVLALDTYIDKTGVSSHILSEGISVTMGDVANFKDPQKVNNMYIQARDLKVSGSLDIKSMESDTSTSMTKKFNKFANINLYNYTSGAKLGKFEMVEFTTVDTSFGGNMETKSNDLYIKFNDGTQETAESFFKKHMDKISDFIKNDLFKK